MTASWDGIPDPDERAFVVGSLDGPFRGEYIRALEDARSNAKRWGHSCVYAWVDGQHIRVPDGDPPKPAPVITVDGVECKVDGWVLVEPFRSRWQNFSHSIRPDRPHPDLDAAYPSCAPFSVEACIPVPRNEEASNA